MTDCNTKTVTATAPCRADLAGGTLDIHPLGLLHPHSLTVNLAVPVSVDLRATADESLNGIVEHRLSRGEARRFSVEESGHDLTAAICFHLRPQGGLRIEVVSQAPIGSGLGGSSAYGIALARATAVLQDRELNDRTVVNLVRNLEARVLQAPTGCQDHWAAVGGGVLALHIEPGGDRPEKLEVDAAWLGLRFTLFFTGITHHSGMVNWEVFRRRMEGDPETTEALAQIAVAAGDCRLALLEENEEQVAAALRDEWVARKRLAPEVCPSELQALEEVALAAGGSAFKACGAGGGGSVLVWHDPSRGAAVREALQDAAPGGMLFPSGVAASGCRLERGKEPPSDDHG